MPKQTKASLIDSRVKRAEAGKLVYKVDCSIPFTDELVDAELLNKYSAFLAEHIKIDGKTGQLGEKVKITVDDKAITLTCFKVLFAKRYIKFLSRKFLKQEKLKEYLRLVSTAKHDYQLRYYNIHLDEEAAEE